MTDFKVGDKVKCIIDTGYYNALTLNKIYEVIRVQHTNTNNNYLHFIDDSGNYNSGYEYRFELVESTSWKTLKKKDNNHYAIISGNTIRSTYKTVEELEQAIETILFSGVNAEPTNYQVIKIIPLSFTKKVNVKIKETE